jgi:hypothetical protein
MTNKTVNQDDNPYKSSTSLKAPFSCDKCNQILDSVQGLKEHMATVHQEKHIEL